MNAVVKLMDLTDSLEMASEESSAYLDLQTGTVVIVQNYLLRRAENAKDDTIPDNTLDWEEDEYAAARAIDAADKRYLALPDKFDFHEYHHMERFIGTIADDRTADQLWRAIKGKGAFRHFKDTAHRLGLIDDWYRYRDEALKKFMLGWAEVNNVPVDKTPGRTGPG